MPPTEASLLSSFLLSPAPLPAAISLKRFTQLFPSEFESSQQLISVYRELQHQRAIDIDDIRSNIRAECVRGEAQSRQVKRARERSQETHQDDLDQRELQIEGELSGLAPFIKRGDRYLPDSVVGEMETAVQDIEAEIAQLEQHIQRTSEDIDSVVGGLSDLRYGKFNHIPGIAGDAAEDAVKSLHRLDERLSTRSYGKKID